MGNPKLVANVDYYMERGKMVLTAHFLLKRGYCCNSGCRHCPYKEGGSMPNGAVTIIGVQGPTPGEETPGEETPGESSET